MFQINLWQNENTHFKLKTLPPTPPDHRNPEQVPFTIQLSSTVYSRTSYGRSSSIWCAEHYICESGNENNYKRI